MTEASPLQVLLVEDNQDHAELALRSLLRHSQQITLHHVVNLEEAFKWLNEKHADLVITDLNLPDGRGTEFLSHHAGSVKFPVVIITSLGDEHLAVDAIKSGAQDYVTKSNETYQDLFHIIQRAVSDWQNQQARIRAEEQLRNNEARFRSIFTNSPIGIIHFNQEGIVTDVNDRFVEIVESSREGLIGMNLTTIPRSKVNEGVLQALAGEEVDLTGEYFSLTTNKRMIIHVAVSPICISGSRVDGGIAIVEDITERENAKLIQSSMYEIASLASRVTDQNELFAEIHRIIKGLIPAENFFIALWDKSENSVTFPYFVDQYDPNPGPRKFSNGMTEYVLKTGQTFFARPENYRKLNQEHGVRDIGTTSVDWLGVPLKNAEGEVLGAVVVQSYDEKIRYTEAEKSILEYVSTQVAGAIERFRSHEIDIRYQRFMEALLDTTSLINSSLEITQVFDEILKNLDRFIKFDSAQIMLIDGADAGIHTEFGKKVEGQENILRVPWVEIPGFRFIAETGEPLILPDVSDYRDWVKTDQGEWIRSYAGFPLMIKNKVIGFLNMNSATSGYFTRDNVKHLMAFANQAAIAIENARLYTEVQKLAIVDELTGIYNRRGFQEIASHDVERAHRHDLPMSLLFLDIDNFKSFNDTYGYSVGDDVLKIFANSIKTHLRASDLCGRYGGDEFVILLSETRKDEAHDIAKRVQASVWSEKIIPDDEQVRITTSIGVFSCSSKCPPLDVMIDRASKLLQKSKKLGKNMIQQN